MLQHRYLGRGFQVIFWSWKNETKTQSAIDNLMGVVPQIREMLDAQKSAKESKNKHPPNSPLVMRCLHRIQTNPNSVVETSTLKTRCYRYACLPSSDAKKRFRA